MVLPVHKPYTSINCMVGGQVCWWVSVRYVGRFELVGRKVYVTLSQKSTWNFCSSTIVGTMIWFIQ